MYPILTSVKKSHNVLDLKEDDGIPSIRTSCYVAHRYFVEYSNRAEIGYVVLFMPCASFLIKNGQHTEHFICNAVLYYL
jgi:hypothetical protein